MPILKPEQFPRLARPVRAKWAPVLLAPLMGSPEQLVVGVVAVGDSGFYIERANALRRFECLYGKMAETAIFAAEVALDNLATDLAERGLKAITEPRTSFSGVAVGPVSEGEASSLEEVARNWMISLSSLYNADQVLALEAKAAHAMMIAEDSGFRERLPLLVLHYVADRRPGLAKFFNADVREQRQRRGRARIQGVIIDFSGSHLVANFGTLMLSNRAISVDRIKRRMWDLKVNRDREINALGERAHEMIVQHSGPDDPQINEGQYAAILETIGDLSEQAEEEEIGFSPMTSVKQIGEHILGREAA